MEKSLKVSIFTPSYNKGAIAVEGIQSVLNQTYQNFEYIVADNSTDDHTRDMVRAVTSNQPNVRYYDHDYTPEYRKAMFVGSELFNYYMTVLHGDLLIYKSDDDTLHPETFARCVDFFTTHPDAKAGWFSMETTVENQDGTFSHLSEIRADRDIGLGTQWPTLDCMVDGGQIMYRRECIKAARQPLYTTDWLVAHHADGQYMDMLAKQYRFYKIDDTYLLNHRRCKNSTFTDAGVR